ncbi:MAG: DUF1844 domain-containing protein [Candidatus Omnitrophota bacterium]
MDESKKESQEKKIDESWKEAIEKEKDVADNQAEEHPAHDEHDANFSFFISSLAMQAFVFLGLMPDPMSQKVQKDLVHAKYIIDTLQMLKDKTKNNLTTEEQANLDETLYALQMQFIEQSKL